MGLNMTQVETLAYYDQTIKMAAFYYNVFPSSLLGYLLKSFV